jgi:hypothetical protein
VATRSIWLTPLWWEGTAYRRLPAPLTESVETQEDEFPWRVGRARIIRIPFTRKAMAVGRWTGEQPHEIVDGIPLLNFRPLDHPEDYFHVLDERTNERPTF